MLLRDLESRDLDGVLALNESEVPRVSSLDRARLVALVALSEQALVVDVDDRLGAFVLTLAPGAAYDSVNYGYFQTRGGRFLYVDRIVVAEHARRRGVASHLYDAIGAHATRYGFDEVTCEVNVRPPNAPSSAFHAARGFVGVGEQETAGGSVRVELLALPVTGV
ncbi:MAG: GNAT family N-acetyltransferase [Nitriliruptoraceae bacterium]